MVQIRVSPKIFERTQKNLGSGGIRTHASEETGALNQRLRPLGHATLLLPKGKKTALSLNIGNIKLS